MNYPNQLDDKNSLFEVKDLGRTSTSKPIDAVELEIEIDNPINFPTGRHIVVVESEVIIISHRIDNILYVEKRGAFDTLSENHITNSKIGVVFTSAHYETLRDSIIDIQKEIWTYRKPVNDVLDDPQTIIPVENESYLVGLSPLNEFIGKENNIATWNGTSWDFISPQPAFEMYILNKGKYEFNGTSWVLNKDVEISNVNDLENQLDNRYTKSENDNLLAELDTKTVKLTGNETIAGIKTFTSSPIVPTPTTDFQVATKEYVDSRADGGGIDYAQLKSIEEPLLNNDEFMIFRDGKPYKVSLQSLSNYLGNDLPATEYTDLNGQVLTDLENNYYTSL